MLHSLLSETAVLESFGDLDVEIAGITADSRDVQPGFLYIARVGQKADGRTFVHDAVRAGARAIVVEPPALTGVDVPVVVVPHSRQALADLSAAYYGYPSRSIGLCGVTGTDGKTTTTHLIAAILAASGVRTGFMSTIEHSIGGCTSVNLTAQTTPEAPIIQSALAKMRDSGESVGVLEVSSHSLMTDRVRGCSFDCAVFTNLAPEHLDFHGSVEHYRLAKSRLFAMLDDDSSKKWGRLAVLNRDDLSYSSMRAATSAPVLDFGFSVDAAVRGEILRESLDGTIFRVESPLGSAEIHTWLPGRYNVLNWLAAISAASHFGATLDDAERGATEFRGVPGRLTRIDRGQPFEVFVDFAHTPQALDAVLGELRGGTRGRLIALFGQAGHRDVLNREAMVRAVSAHADLAIVTSDDPYDEDPDSIVDDLGGAFDRLGWVEGTQYWRIVDRVDAIRFAIERAKPEDCVLLAGRGAEDTTVIGNRRFELDDRAVASTALATRSC